MKKLKKFLTIKKILILLVIAALLVGLYLLERKFPAKIRVFQKAQILATNIIIPENIHAEQIVEKLKAKTVKESLGTLGDCTGDVMDLYELQTKQSDVFFIGKIIEVKDVDKSKDATRLKPAKVTYKILIPIKGITFEHSTIETYYNLSNQIVQNKCCERRPPPLTGVVEAVMLNQRPDGKFIDKSPNFCLAGEAPITSAEKEAKNQNNHLTGAFQ